MKNKKNEIKKQMSVTEATKPLSTSKDSNIISDYDGSYTGVPVDDKYSKPVQDADDL